MKKIISVLLVSMMLVSMFITGCSKDEETTTPAATDAKETAVETTAAPAEAEEVTLNIFISQPRFRDQYEAYLDLFAAKYLAENNVKVSYELEMPSADTADEILKTRLTTGDALDVFMLHAINDIPSFYKAGYLEDLSGEAFVETLYDSVKSAITIDNKVVAVPLESLTWGYLYNKKVFSELGLKPAMTLTEMKANVDALNTAGKTPFLAAYNEAWIPQLFLPLTTGALVSTTHLDFLDKMNTNATSYSELASLFDIIDLVHANSNKDGLEIAGSDGCAKFASGDYGMWVQGPWFSSTILESDPNFELGVAPLPISDNADETKINAAVSTSLAVSTFSKNKEVSKALISFMLDPVSSNDFFTSVQFNPLSTVHTFEAYPWVAETTQYLESGKAYVDLTIPSAVKDESGKLLQAYYADAATKEEIIGALDKAWQTFNEIN